MSVAQPDLRARFDSLNENEKAHLAWKFLHLEPSISAMGGWANFHRWATTGARLELAELQAVIDDLGPWASAAQEDPAVCDELKAVFLRLLGKVKEVKLPGEKK